MGLTPNRVDLVTQSPHDHEMAAIKHAIDALPNNDPYRLYGLFEILEPSTGRLYEYDLLIIGYSDLYHVEIKSGPGRYEGDSVDWYRVDEAGARRFMEPPLRLANRKSKILKSRLIAQMREPARCPFIQTLVFLSAPDVTLALKPDGLAGVVTRKTFARAITHHEFPGAGMRSQPGGIPRPIVEDVRQALAKLGLRKRESDSFAGSWRLGEIVEEGAGYQDRTATHREHEAMRRRARIYLVPQQERVERRQQLRRAADREWRVLWELRDHPNILRASDQIPDAPLGPVVLFDDVPGAVPLDSFLRENPTLAFEDRLAIVEQIGRALSYCHKKGVVHGAVSPQSVLVRQLPTGALETRLYDFQLAESETVSGTHHWTQLASEQWAVYQAPELRRDPSARSPASDLFSLGALAVFVFTGRPPAGSIADVEVRLQTRGSLAPDPGETSQPGWLIDMLELGTGPTLAQRGDDVDSWLDLLRSEYESDLEERTRPAAPPRVDPLHAEAGDAIDGGLGVLGVLGQGATARVLEVVRTDDNRHFALKVPLSPDHDARIEAEGAELGRLDHANVVRLEKSLVLDGRPCLLMSLAGTETLFRKIQREGSLGLDYAIRFGEDLLQALRHLETNTCLHRDIKPANLGVGAADKKAQRLTLFDFSLAGAPLTELQIGTAVYRDPFLFTRGRWDAAADRWSAAVTLHEMLTGVRPSFGGRPGGELDPDAPLVLAAERFDAAVRDRLVRFFERALARDVERRFDSAESMLRSWSACFADPLFSKEPTPHAAPPVDEPPFDWSKLALEAPLAALPIDLRAKNALDRAGLVTAGELLSIADNRLSAIRGIGSQTARAILEARDRWRAARGPNADAAPPEPAFHPGYVGPDLLLGSLELDVSLAQALENAGLGTLRTVSLGPAAQVTALARRHQVEPDVLHTLLVREAAGDADAARPATLDAWVDALFSKGTKKSPAWPRRLFGIEPSAEGAHESELDVTTLAARFDVTTANIYIALGRWRKDLRASKALTQLRALVLPLLDDAGGATALLAFADALLERIAYAADAPRPVIVARAAALVRALAEAEKPLSDDDAPASLSLTRAHGRLIAVASEAHATAVRALGAAADELAERPVVASSAEVSRALADAVAGTPLATLPPERLLDLATLASARAAISARREIYPRGLAASRALELSAPFPAGVTPEEIARRVAQRYPGAEPLPPRPALDDFVRAMGLTWDDDRALYVRPGDNAGSTRATAFSGVARAHTTIPQHRTTDDAAVEARAFEERIRHAKEQGLFRVVAVSYTRAVDAAFALSRTLGVAPVELDRRLASAMRALMSAKNVAPKAVTDADCAGPGSPTFRNLAKLAHDAGDALLQELLAARAPLLLVQPGLLARYRMEPFVRALVAAARRDDQPAVFLLVPAIETNGVPSVNGEMALPGVLREDVLWAPRVYLENRQNAAA